MTRTSLIALAAFLAALAAGCGGAPDGDRLGVVVSIPPQAQFVERIGGDLVHVTVMVPSGASPHQYEPSPSQLAAVADAALYVAVGSGIEFEIAWLDRIRSANPDIPLVVSAEGIEPAPASAHVAGGEAPETDTHVWVSPRNAAVMARNTCDGLVAVDPAHAGRYEAGLDSLLAELDALDRAIRASLANASRRRFLVYHPSWGYFARDYGLEQIAIEHEGKEPSARGIAELVETARRLGIVVIFASPQFTVRSAEIVAREIGGRVVFVDPLGRDYLATMRAAAEAFGASLE
ncbi:MAG: zinc ABC transporter substrate-binding protein [Candidatus Krumholzibacteriota bacterium]|nr:zinc ABC transporter substrate-binding protein [Candidatus Krumholzibacteriota bacterium]